MNEMILDMPMERDDLNLPVGAAVEMDGKIYVVQSKMRTPTLGYVLGEPHVPGEGFPISSEEMKSKWRLGHAVFRASGFEKLSPEKQENLRLALDAFDKSARIEISRRWKYCELVDRLPNTHARSAAAMQPLLNDLAGDMGDSGPHSWSSVRRWHNDWILAAGDPRVLCPNHHLKGNKQAKVPAEIDLALDEAVQSWLSKDRPTMSWVYGHVLRTAIKAAGAPELAFHGKSEEPYLQALRDRCKKVDRVTMLLERHGPQVARQAMTPVGLGVDVKFSLQRVELDFMYMPLFIVDDGPNPLPLGTPFIMAGVDCYSGVVAGFDVGFDPPSYVSAARCLKHMISFKDLSGFPADEYGSPAIKNTYPVNGVPFEMAVDNDRAFHAESFIASAKALGCNVHFVPPGQPWKKGHIERFWNTVQQTYFGGISGKVFKPGERPHDYDPSEHGVMTLTQFKLMLTKAIVDIHNAGFDEWTGERRVDLWFKGLDTREALQRRHVRPIPDHNSLIELVGAYAIRTADRRGIRIFGLRYNSPELAGYRNGFAEDPRVQIRYDPQDLSQVWVVDRDRHVSFPVPCTRIEYAQGLSAHQHRVIRASVARKSPQGRIHIQQLLVARAELFEMAESMLRTRKSKQGRLRTAQFLGVGRELIDALARSPFDAEKSRKHLQIGHSSEGDQIEPQVEEPEAVEDQEDDRRADEEARSAARAAKRTPPSTPVSASRSPGPAIPVVGSKDPDQDAPAQINAGPVHQTKSQMPKKPRITYD